MVVAPPEPELGDFPEERDWFLLGKSYVTALSTSRGRRMMDAGEIVHFAFPSSERIYVGMKVSAKKATALSEIVRFSTKRAGEIGKLSPDWAKDIVRRRPRHLRAISLFLWHFLHDAMDKDKKGVVRVAETDKSLRKAPRLELSGSGQPDAASPEKVVGSDTSSGDCKHFRANGEMELLLAKIESLKYGAAPACEFCSLKSSGGSAAGTSQEDPHKHGGPVTSHAWVYEMS